MKTILVGTLSTIDYNHFIAPFLVVEAPSAREAIRIYNTTFNYFDGEAMCIVDKKSGRPSHIHQDTDFDECLSAIELATNNE